MGLFVVGLSENLQARNFDFTITLWKTPIKISFNVYFFLIR